MLVKDHVKHLSSARNYPLTTGKVQGADVWGFCRPEATEALMPPHGAAR